LFYYKIFHHYLKAIVCPPWQTRKKPFDVICCQYKMKQSHWLLCLAKNCDWSRKITPLSNLTQMVSCGMKTYSESRIELQNPQLLKRMQEKWRQFLSSVQLCEPKAWVLNERFISNGRNLCPLWLMTLKSVWHHIGDTL